MNNVQADPDAQASNQCNFSHAFPICIIPLIKPSGAWRSYTLPHTFFYALIMLIWWVHFGGVGEMVFATCRASRLCCPPIPRLRTWRSRWTNLWPMQLPSSASRSEQKPSGEILALMLCLRQCFCCGRQLSFSCTSDHERHAAAKSKGA